MNLRQSYEQLIADKLRQLPAQDVNASWQQMKRLLDDDEDTRAGGRRRPPGNNGWWRIGIIAVVLSAGFWLYVEKNNTPETLSKNHTAPVVPSGNSTTESNNPDKNKTASIGNTSTLNKANTTTGAADNKPDNKTATGKLMAPVGTGENMAAGLADQKTASTNAVKSSATTTGPGNNAIKIKGDDRNTGNGIAAKGNYTGTTASSKATDITNTKKNTRYTTGRGREDIVTAAATNASGNVAGQNAWTPALHHRDGPIKTGTGKRAGVITSNDSKTTYTDNENNSSQLAGNTSGPVDQPVAAGEETWFEKVTGLKISGAIPPFNTSLPAGDSLETNRDISNLLNSETKKSVAKAQREKAIALLDKKDKKTLRLDLSNVFKPFSLHVDAEPWWAAGIALNAGITLGAQNRYNYTANAKSGTLSDYIPSPYLQYHLNNYVYLQTELNFITPQYTPQLLVYRKDNEITAQAGISQQKSIYIKKLYYFNWPVSLHYSPVSNLYFSGGIQFSSFQSGLAAIEEKQFTTALGPDHASNISTSVLKFKDDSIAAKIAPNEWRWQVGAEYYWNRFSVGLRYNRSFKDAINTKASPSLPATVNRNESLLFFVRYNLFESRKK